MITSEVLREALRLLSEGRTWTKGAYARDAEGRSVASYNKFALSFCTTGAICRASGSERTLTGEFKDAVACISYQLPYSQQAWNDNASTTFSEVREVFNRAICEAEFKERIKL